MLTLPAPGVELERGKVGLTQYLNLFVVLCMPESRAEALCRLYEVAEDQQGLFTTKQAKAAGFAENTHPYHVQVGNWIREYRGIYRLALFPATEHPDLVQWAPWFQKPTRRN